jgi:hypothetical protein
VELVAALSPASRGLQLDALTQLREPLPALPAVPIALPQQLQLPATSLALLSEPARLLETSDPDPWAQLLGPVLRGALERLPASLPALVAAEDQGPLLWAQSGDGWLLGTQAQQPPLEVLDAALASEGYSNSPLQSRGLTLQAWTKLQSKPVKGNPDQLQAQLAGARSLQGGWAWWGQGLSVLNQQDEGRHAPAERLEQLESLGTPKAPVQWAMDGPTAQQLLAVWQPWRLVSALSSSELTPLVDGAALSLEGDGPSARALRLRGLLQFKG